MQTSFLRLRELVLGARGAFGRLLLALLLLPAATAAQNSQASSGSSPARPADHVIVLSLDGLVPEYISNPEQHHLNLPNIRALRDRGSYALGVIGQYPSSTYPSHTSIVTGVRPARHGVFQNTRFDGASSNAWYFESSSITSATVWQLANQAGLSTAGVSWPVTVGAQFDVLFPEGHQSPPNSTWLATAREQSSPGLIDAVVAELGGFGERDNLDPVKRDIFAVAVARHMLRTQRPNLLLVHLVQTDYAQHATGRHSPESKLAFARLDRHVGEIVSTVRELGLLERTTFVVTGDHGFASLHSTFQPNVVLRDAGFLDTDEAGNITSWRAVADRATVKLKDPTDETLAHSVATLFQDLIDKHYSGLLEIVGREQLDRLGADPRALFFLEPADGYSVGGGLADDAFLIPTNRRGYHGSLPTKPELHTGLLISGAGAKQGVKLPIARQIDIAPTIAHLLGFLMPTAEGVAMVGVLEE